MDRIWAALGGDFIAFGATPDAAEIALAGEAQEIMSCSPAVRDACGGADRADARALPAGLCTVDHDGALVLKSELQAHLSGHRAIAAGAAEALAKR